MKQIQRKSTCVGVCMSFDLLRAQVIGIHLYLTEAGRGCFCGSRETLHKKIDPSKKKIRYAAWYSELNY